MRKIIEGLGTYLHPLIFASFAALSLQANNIREVGLSGARAILLSIAVGLCIYLLAWWFVKDRVRSSLVASGFILVFFSYGHIVDLAAGLIPKLDETVLGWLILMGMLLLLGGWLFFLFRVADQARKIAQVLTVSSLFLVMYPSYRILATAAEERRTYPHAPDFLGWVVRKGDVPGLTSLEERGSSGRPDIYHIVVDAYSRGDVLKDVYDYDNSEFLTALEELGFEVVEGAHSNYPMTVHSIASTVNMVHVNLIPRYLRDEGLSPQMGAVNALVNELVGHSRVRGLLQDLGYTFVSFDSGYGATRITDADQFIASDEIEDVGLAQFGFEMMLLETTVGKQLINLLGEERSPHNHVLAAHRARIEFTLGELPEVAAWPGDYLVFAHIISPHVPFVFGPNGEHLKSDDPFTLMRPEQMDSTVRRLYRDQVHYLNSLLLDTIEDILSRSDSPPIILLHSDHGSRLSDAVDLTATEDLDLYFPILLAVYLPGADAEPLHDHPSPVNLFRYVFNSEFEAEMPYLPDSRFIPTTRAGEAVFLDVCQDLGMCD